jgi:hypothetical protein
LRRLRRHTQYHHACTHLDVVHGGDLLVVELLELDDEVAHQRLEPRRLHRVGLAGDLLHGGDEATDLGVVHAVREAVLDQVP